MMNHSCIGLLRRQVVWLLLSVFCFGLGAAMAQPPTRSPYAGDWEFTFSGRDNGSGRFTVDADGHITGMAHSEFIVERKIDGTVDDSGLMDWEVADTEFAGKADPNGNAVGTWQNSKLQRAGGWSAKRMDADAGTRSKHRKQK